MKNEKWNIKLAQLNIENSPHAIKKIEIKSETHLISKLSNQTQKNKPKWTKPSEVSKWSYLEII